ncbi:MAG TPA: hypothetical protein VIQ05_25355 [Tardiphaga sp.]
MTEPTDHDHGLLGLVDRLLRKPEKPVPAQTTPPEDGLGPPVEAQASPDLLEPQLTAEAPRTCSPQEMAEIILRALRAIDGCPKQGLEVVVYGSRPWNAMLRITPAAGPVADAPAWRARVRAMAVVLRGQYDVVG